MIMAFRIQLTNYTKELHKISSLDKSMDSNIKTQNTDLLGLEKPEDPYQSLAGGNNYEQDQLKRETEVMNEDVDRLADNVTVLHKMFKQMHEMIFEQGTIVDRIDFQIEQGYDRIKKGNQQLFKVYLFMCKTKIFIGKKTSG